MIGNFQQRWKNHGEPKVGDLIHFGATDFGNRELVLCITRLTKTRAICSYYCTRKNQWVEDKGFMLSTKKVVGMAWTSPVTPYDDEVKAHLEKFGRQLKNPETVQREYHAITVKVVGTRVLAGTNQPVYEVIIDGKKHRGQWWCDLTTGEEHSTWERWIVYREDSRVPSHWCEVTDSSTLDRLDDVIRDQWKSGGAL